MQTQVDRGSGAVDVNELRLVGRVSGAVVERELPSGDVVVTFRLVVARPPGGPSKVAVDTLDIACWRPRARSTALRLGDGERVEVGGALRRRFFRTGSGPASRYEVEALSVRRCR